MRVLSFYQYVSIKDPEGFCATHLAACQRIGLHGRILLGKEGINGGVSGTPDQVEAYKYLLWSDPVFCDVVFKEDEVAEHPFAKMYVRVRKEIVVLGEDVVAQDGAQHLSPQDFLVMAQREDSVVVDARNDYEWRVGHFKDAILPPISKFSEFGKVVPALIEDKKDKPVLLYCTGGIRCEKASALLKQKGFTQVYQLSGGILSFGKQCPDTLWEGACFVFDRRMSIPINKHHKPISVCEGCGEGCDRYVNCARDACDKYTVLCASCDEHLNGCCSEHCRTKSISQDDPVSFLP